ncbi:thioredoxin family protein [Sphingomonas baiyangensis]|uniref:Thioredoxin family protein n=1 Tax=Sphingomonas baiyangensis TaxID=2572576 RepID=A0A4U1L9P0_9SPHN|nr:thioredoxin family protein [Sphingomonas baiyangensis]TKD53110.1 thioredoxin family protein [Sphingomonas baiyangensis]
MYRTLAAAALVVAISAPAQAADIRPFDARAFAAAQAAGKPILIEVHAPWCPVCAAQGKAIQKLTAGGAHPDLMIFRIDYDSQKPLWQKFGAQKQSTLIAFRGRTETGRLAYQTDEAKIAALLAGTRAPR